MKIIVHIIGIIYISDIDADYDIEFYADKGVNKAYQAFPFQFSNTSRSFSVAMWVRYSNPGGRGTFFTLYGLE